MEEERKLLKRAGHRIAWVNEDGTLEFVCAPDADDLVYLRDLGYDVGPYEPDQS